MKQLVLPVLAASVLGSFAPTAMAGTFTAYSNDFSVDAAGTTASGVTATWAVLPSGTVGVDTAPSGEQFLGLDDGVDLGFANNAVTLTLTGLPTFDGFTLSFDLYVINSWDGNEFSFGPDIFLASAKWGGSSVPLIHTTFSNWADYNQSYTDNLFGDHPYTTGAAATATLGYTYGTVGDATYSLGSGWGFGPVTDGTLVITFAGLGLQGLYDESWGIDNVKIDVSTPVPEPEGYALFLAGLGLLGIVVRRRI